MERVETISWNYIYRERNNWTCFSGCFTQTIFRTQKWKTQGGSRSIGGRYYISHRQYVPHEMAQVSIHINTSTMDSCPVYNCLPPYDLFAKHWHASVDLWLAENSHKWQVAVPSSQWLLEMLASVAIYYSTTQKCLHVSSWCDLFSFCERSRFPLSPNKTCVKLAQCHT